jgi:hypothetical protein
VKQHHENTLKIQHLQRENAELSKLFSTNLTALSEARTLLSSLPDSSPATIDSMLTLLPQLTCPDKIPYQQILEYASKISKFTSPPPQWDPTRPQQPGISPSSSRLRLLGSYVPWPSEDAMRRGRLAQLAVEGLGEPTPEADTQDTEMEEPKPRRNPGRRATSVEARRRKMSGEPKSLQLREKEKEKEVEFELDLFNPDEDS